MNLYKSISWRLYKLKLAISNYCEGRSQFEIPNCVRIQTPEDTLLKVRELIENKIAGIYLRFGDGDVNIIRNFPTIAEEPNPRFSKELREAFNLYGPGIMKCLMIHSERFGKKVEMSYGEHEIMNQNAEAELRRVYEYFIGCVIYSHAALSYTAVYNRPFTIEFLSLLKKQSSVFVGNQALSHDLIQKLFAPREIIPVPTQNAYDRIDDIEKQCLKSIEAKGGNFQVFILACGCAGRVLAKRIYLKNKQIFFFDFSSLMDVLNGPCDRTWVRQAKVPQSYWEDMVKEVSKF